MSAQGEQLSTPSAHKVEVEVVFIRVGGHGERELEYRFVRSALLDGQLPDDAAAALAGMNDAAGRRVAVLHSTSWRYEAGDGLVLTYAAAPDPDAHAAAAVLTAPSVVSSGDPRRPSPDFLHAHHVAAHAVRHLADLAQRDPAIADVASTHGQRILWDAVAGAARVTPTGTHSEVHAAVMYPR